MALIQALIAFLGRSSGKILNAVFGWAVRALFGTAGGKDETWLTLIVALAALWPLLVLGIFAPRVTAFLIAFVPIPKWVPETSIRIVWLALTALLPAIVGIAIAAKGRAVTNESVVTRIARGYPTTVALSVAAWITALSVPILRLSSAVRRQTDAYLPVITTGKDYQPIADRIVGVLNTYAFRLEPRPAPWWVRTPMSVMRSLGGPALRQQIPERLAYYIGDRLELILYPSSVLVRGPEVRTAFARALVAEALTGTNAFQTIAKEAQAIESQIQHAWAAAGRGRNVANTDEQLRAIVQQLTHLEASYDDWQTLYREALQLSRALQKQAQLLEQKVTETDANRATEQPPHRANGGASMAQMR